MHFFYGLGAFVSPMIASPFLLNIDCTPFIDGYTAEPLTEHSNTTVAIAPQPKVVDRAMRLSHSKEAFFILGSIQVSCLSSTSTNNVLGSSGAYSHKAIYTERNY